MVFLAEIGNRLMVEGFAEAVGVVAHVGLEGVGQRVALSLEEQAHAVVLGEGLIDDSGGAVGRDEQREERRFLGLHLDGVLAVDGVGCQFFVVLLHVALVFVAKGLVYRRSEMAAQ